MHVYVKEKNQGCRHTTYRTITLVTAGAVVFHFVSALTLLVSRLNADHRRLSTLLRTNQVLLPWFVFVLRTFLSSSFERKPSLFHQAHLPAGALSYLLPQSFSQELLNTPTVVLFQQPSEASAPFFEAGSSQMSPILRFSPALSQFMGMFPACLNLPQTCFEPR